MAAADSTRITFAIDFPINSSTVDPDFGANACVLDSLRSFIYRSDDDLRILDFKVDGLASPDGHYDSNMALAERRMLALCDYILSHYVMPVEVTVRPGECYVAWPQFREAVSRASMPGAARIIDISSEGDDRNTDDSRERLRQLRQLDGGRVWRRLASDILPGLRNAVVVTLSTARMPEPQLPQEPEEEPAPMPVTPAENPVAISAEEPGGESVEAPAPEPDACGRGRWHVGTNLLEWSLAIVNATGEYDFARRWSASISLHYSAWDYGKTTRKFRTFIFRPEVRFWLRDCHKGFFLNAHLQMAAYNFALPGWNYRIQDTGGKHPALGGGIGAGYRVHLDGRGRWSFQADLGIGVYHLDYNRFENRKNGPLADRKTRTWAGIDHVGISLIYNFNSSRR